MKLQQRVQLCVQWSSAYRIYVVNYSVQGMLAVYCFRCLVENTSIAIQHGVVCDARRLELRDCSQYQTCSECLAQWPAFPGTSRVRISLSVVYMI
jgi:hypothetical protein